uniref:Uncharacterized protein n=1 Tax=Caenorhabditis japonica TaxID=281687 RepID=A0A8R1EHD0_CAEJA
MVRPTKTAFQAAPKVTSQKSGDKIGEKNVFVMRGGALIPASIAVSKDARPVRVAAQKEEKPTVLALSDDEPPPLMDIKKEPIDEEVEVKLEPAEPAFNTIKEGEQSLLFRE